MDNRVKYGILILAGGVGIYIIWKGGYFQQWFPSLFGTTTPTPTTPSAPAPTTPKALTPPNPPPGAMPPPNPNNYPPAGTQSIVNGATYQADGKGGWVLVKAAPTPPTTPTQLPTYCDLNTPGWSLNAQGQCAPTPATSPTQLISQQMVAQAGKSNGLSLDEWCYEYTAVTGQQCPFDPGNILPQEFNDAGVHLDDGTIGDRTTPTSIDTWLAFVNLKAPGSGISGLSGLAALHVANAWLV